MSEYTALDKVVLFHDQNCTFGACAGHEARAELAALRSRVAELELSAANGTEIMWQNAKLTKRIVELEDAQAETLTPRQCVTCTKLAEQMREDCAKFADDFDGEDLGFDVPTSIGACIRALPLPTCGTCNPLAPKPQSQASLSEQLRELVQLANANGLYDAADYIRRED